LNLKEEDLMMKKLIWIFLILSVPPIGIALLIYHKFLAKNN